MGRTRRGYYSNKTYEFGLAYPFKSKRAKLRGLIRSNRHAFRNQNKYCDQLHFMSFKQSPFRCNYKQNSQSSGNIIGQQYQFETIFDQNFTSKSWDQENVSLIGILRNKIRELQKYENGGPRLYTRCPRTSSDIFIAACKQLKRRGTLQPFRGHRNSKELYKRQLYTIY